MKMCDLVTQNVQIQYEGFWNKIGDFALYLAPKLCSSQF